MFDIATIERLRDVGYRSKKEKSENRARDVAIEVLADAVLRLAEQVEQLEGNIKSLTPSSSPDPQEIARAAAAQRPRRKSP